MTTPQLANIAAFMAERHSIYLRRKAGEPGPWTTDPVLRSGRFCNVFRELDTVTIWIRKNIREPYADHPLLWLMLAIARYINWPPTLQRLIDGSGSWPGQLGFRPRALAERLERIAASGEKVYTGAYMIRAESDHSKEWFNWSKHRYIAEIVIGRLWEDRDLFEKSLSRPDLRLSEFWDILREPRYIGWGPFMAYEVVTDMRHTRYLCRAPDIYTWANAGPGAIRGLNRLYGRPLKTQPKPEQTNEEMCLLMAELNDYTGDHFRNTFGPVTSTRFEMRDIEHTLCEFDKYRRVKSGEGKMRSKYDWRKATVLPQ